MQRVRRAFGLAQDVHFVLITLGAAVVLGSVGATLVAAPWPLRAATFLGLVLVAIGVLPLVADTLFERLARPSVVITRPRISSWPAANQGDSYQVARVAVHHARETGGKRSTVRRALAQVEILDHDGSHVHSVKGWGSVLHPKSPEPRDFTINQVEAEVELATKYRSASTCNIGGAEVSGSPITAVVTIRAQNLRPPVSRAFILKHQGANSELELEEEPSR